MDEASGELLARWRGGDQRAAGELFDRYALRLLGLARSRLSQPLAARVDAEDVVQSVWRSFFIGAKQGRFVLARSGDLWRLLAALAIQKLRRQAEWHSAAKRAIGREFHGDLAELPDEALIALAEGPSPDEAAAVADEVANLMRRLDEQQRQMLELRLQGCMLEEIAVQTNRSQRTVRRLLEEVRAYLQRRYQEEPA